MQASGEKLILQKRTQESGFPFNFNELNTIPLSKNGENAQGCGDRADPRITFFHHSPAGLARVQPDPGAMR